MEPTDNELVSRYRDGDADALGTLVERYRRPLFAYLLNMTDRQADVDELFQEIWFRVIRKLHLYKKKNFYGWLIRMAHNLTIDSIRRRKPDFSLDAEISGGGSRWVDTLPGPESDPKVDMADSELGNRIREALQTLPPEQREVFVMRAYQDMAFKEVAAVQRVSINTALARMQYALTKLRPLLEQDYENL
jgi:RNA polymerase sigma-70 factor (ECF subfamily)